MATRDHMTVDLSDHSAVLICRDCGWRVVLPPDRPSAWVRAARHLKSAHGLLTAGHDARNLAAIARRRAAVRASTQE